MQSQLSVGAGASLEARFHRLANELRCRGELAAYDLTNAVMRTLPASASYAVVRQAADRIFRLRSRRVRWALANTELAFPTLPVREHERIVRDSLVNLGYGLVDLARIADHSPQQILERCPLEDDVYVDRALERGRGALLLTLHIGNWELAVQSLGVQIERHRPCAVGRPISNLRLYARVAEQRQRSGVELIDREGALVTLMRRLRQNRPVAMLNDQYARGSRGVLAPFFGMRVPSPAGLAALALRSRAPIVPCYSIRIAAGRYWGRFLPEVDFEVSGHYKRDLVEVTTRCNQVLEQIVREAPDQWLWLHRRFRNSPDVCSDPYGS